MSLEAPDHSGNEPDRARWRASELLLLVLACVALAAACVLVSPKKYFWGDEVFSWTVVTDPSLGHMLTALSQAADGAPPLFYLVARLSSMVFGANELTLRAVSCLGFIGALAVMWAALRRVYGMWLAAVASVTVVAMSELVHYQIAEARFYGLLTFLVACAVSLSVREVETRRYPWPLFLLTTLVHAALLYTHVYGILYSAAVLGAWIVADRVQRRPLDARYLSVIAGWTLFVPWIPALRRIAATGKPHGWLTVPHWPDLVNAYGFKIQYVPLIVVAIAVLAAAAQRLTDAGQRSPGMPSPRRRAVLQVAVVAVAVGAPLWWGPRAIPTMAGAWNAWTSASSLTILAVVLAALTDLVWARVRATRAGGDVLPSAGREERLLIAGGALLLVPVVAYVTSQMGTPIFLDRYLIPSSLGVMPMLAHFAGRRAAEESSGRAMRARPGVWSIAIGAAWALLVTAIAVRPAWINRHLQAQPRPGVEIEAVAPPGATVVVEGVLDLLPLRHYQRRQDLAYVYPLDWASALDPHSSPGAVLQYNLMDIWRRLGYLSAPTANGARVPCEGRPLVVAHSWRLSWYNDRIAHDSAFSRRTLGQSWSTMEKSGIVLVSPRPGLVPVMCHAPTSVTDANPDVVRSHPE